MDANELEVGHDVPLSYREEPIVVDIFRTIQKTTSKIEPFHSQFLGDALRESVEGERSLFDRVWGLCAPQEWTLPRNPEILNERALEGGQRIDLLIRDRDTGRVLGIEVKTSRASPRAGQLQDYLRGLLNQGVRLEDIAMAYLTPFNRERAEKAIGEKAGLLPAVRVFEAFADGFERARHVSWLDVADIEWDGRAIWSQHRRYVRERMASAKGLKVWRKRNRALDAFFSVEAVEAFWNELSPLLEDAPDGAGGVIDLESIVNEGEEAVRDAVDRLERALIGLIREAKSVASQRRSDRFDESLRQPFLESRCRAFHEMLFGLAARFGPVWIQGEKDYGVRVAHRGHSSGISLVTSDGPGRLSMGGPK